MFQSILFSKLITTVTCVMSLASTCDEAATPIKNPPPGTIIQSECQGFTLVETVANGDGTTFEQRTPESAACGYEPPEPLACGGDLPTESFVLSPVTIENDIYTMQGERVIEDREGYPDYSHAVVDNPELAASGNLFERYEIRSIESCASECQQRNYLRSESRSDYNNLRGWDRWFGMSFNIGEETYDHPIDDGGPDRNQWVSFMQFLEYYDLGDTGDTYGKGNIFIGTKFGTKELAIWNKDTSLPLDDIGTTEETYVLAELGEYQSGWQNLVVNVEFDSGTPSQKNMRIWLNGACVLDRKISSLDEGWDYAKFKWGLYRKKTKYEGVGGENLTQVIYIDNVREGDGYDDIAY